ncbi:MAG: hypothetical protein AAF845_02355 [Bacteroidota bacterium]
MRLLLLVVVLALAAPAVTAQITPPPKLRALGIPVTIQTGSAEIGGRTASGVTTPGLGFTFVGLSENARSSTYVVVDTTGGVTGIVVCSVISCSGLADEQDGDDWFFYDGVILRGDFGGVLTTPVGGVGGGLHLSFSATENPVEDFGWIDYGVQGAYAAGVGPIALVATGTYAWGYEGESQANSGRTVKVRADAVLPREGIDLVGFVAVDRRSDTRGTEAEADDYAATTLTFGVGIGF